MENILAVLSSSSGIYVYLLIVLMLLAGAFAFPFPEDVVFLCAGYMAYRGVIDPNIAIAIGLASIMVGDSIIYFLGNKLGFRIFSLPVIRLLISPKNMERAKKFMDKHGNKSVFISKFIVGLRYSVFFTSGMFSIGYKNFITSDILASCISIPTLIYVAYLNGQRIDKIFLEVRHVEYEILGIFVLVVAIFAIRAYFKKLKADRLKAKLLEEDEV